MISDNEFTTLGEFFRILGDPTRLRILYALENNTQCVGELGASLGLTQSNISHQLRLLKQARLVTSKREGKHVFCSLSDDHVSSILRQGLTHLREIDSPLPTQDKE